LPGSAWIEEHQLELLAPTFAPQLLVDAEQRNSNIGPPRTAVGSLGLPAKPTAMVPPCMARRRSRMALGRRNALAGRDGVLDAGQLLDEAPAAGDHQTRRWPTSPAVVSTCGRRRRPGDLGGHVVHLHAPKEVVQRHDQLSARAQAAGDPDDAGQVVQLGARRHQGDECMGVALAQFAHGRQGTEACAHHGDAGWLCGVHDRTGGIIDSILVREGDHVKVGQVLVRMNDVQIKTKAEITRNQLYTAFQLRGLEATRSSKNQQLALLKEQLDNLRDLAQDGFVPRNRVLETERTYTQLQGEISSDTGNAGRIQRQIAELEQRRIHRLQEYQKEVRQQLSDIKKEADALSSHLQAQEFELANVEVKAPVDGTVVGMNVFTESGVIGPGFKLMDIVPSDDVLVVTGQVPVHLIDKIYVDLPVDLIFTALNQKKTPQIPGIVTQVSADRLIDERTGLPFFNIKAKVTQEGMKQLADQQIRAGMPVEVFIKTGERSLMSYLFKPILDRAHSALSEE
jgi:multidrug efflux pump subunit AcrA (membrane-fusion protein)